MMTVRYPEIAELLNEYFGLDVQLIGRRTFERATASRLSEASQGSYPDYLDRLRAEEGERIRLLDMLVVPETWFFRDSGTFAYLSAFVKDQWCARPGAKILDVLCAPCATGEEAYSIAITLLQTGLDPSQFRIRALDVSPKAVSAAKTAHYGRSSFREPLVAGQARFFTRTGEHSAVCPSVRSLVSFSRGNLVDPAFMAGDRGVFDIVFCKNVMIYLAESGRARVLDNLERLLKEGGLLFVGHSEVALFQKAGYMPVLPARAFGLTKAKQKPERAAGPSERRTARAKAGAGNARARERARSHPAKIPATVFDSNESRGAQKKIDSSRRLLAEAQSLADRGSLQEAAALCRSLIGADSMDVGTYYLAGLIEQSLDRPGPAEDFFLKAIYLDPDHYDTLVQLCLLSERKGDSARAGQYRNRIRRLDTGGKERRIR